MNLRDLLNGVSIAHAHGVAARMGYLSTYKGYGELTTREIEIYAFDPTYIDAFCRLRRAVRTFSVDRVMDLSLLDEPFEVKPQIRDWVQVHGWAHRNERRFRGGTASFKGRDALPIIAPS